MNATFLIGQYDADFNIGAELHIFKSGTAAFFYQFFNAAVYFILILLI